MVKRVIDMTDKLFYKDVRGSEFEAVVTDCKKTENGYEIILDLFLSRRRRTACR